MGQPEAPPPKVEAPAFSPSVLALGLAGDVLFADLRVQGSGFRV